MEQKKSLLCMELRMKKTSLKDFLTDEEIEQCITMFNEIPEGSYAAWVNDNIIDPNIERINKALGQENDSMYLAYMVEFVVSKP